MGKLVDGSVVSFTWAGCCRLVLQAWHPVMFSTVCKASRYRISPACHVRNGGADWEISLVTPVLARNVYIPSLAKLCFCERNSYFLRGTWMRVGILLKTQRHIIIHLSLLHPCDVSCFASWDTGVMMRSFSETEVDDEWRWRNHTFKKLAQVSVTGMESFWDQAMREEHE